MTVEQTLATMNRYFEVMGSDDDFSEFFNEDVRWLMVDSGEEVRGRHAVRDYISELHSRMLSGDQQDLVAAEGHAYLEGSAVNADESRPGFSYCLVYDVQQGRITDMRCYGTLAALMHSSTA
jgi:SnoaL-like domain